jgi:restriction endonuclease Mrr
VKIRRDYPDRRGARRATGREKAVFIGVFATVSALLAGIDYGAEALLGALLFVVVVWLGVAVGFKYASQKEEREREERLQRARQWEEEQRRKRAQREEERRREEQERAEQIEALLVRDALREGIHLMDGDKFEHFMANVLAAKGYHVQTTPKSGDQGVDLLLTVDNRKVAIQLKRYTGPVGNGAVQEVVAGMFHYKAKEAWVITTGSFTKSARQLAKSNRVRLIDGRELEDWLSDLREEGEIDTSESYRGPLAD